MADPASGSLVKFGAALTYIQNLLGYIVNEVDQTQGVAAASPTSPFVSQNGDRVGLLVANIGLQNVFIALTPAVGTGSGFLIVPNGGAIAFNARDDFTLVTRAWWAFATPSPSSIYILELIGVKALPSGIGVSQG